MNVAVIRGLEYYVPEDTLTNEELSSLFPNWPPGKIEAKTGICKRFIAGPGVLASDLAYCAAKKLLARPCFDEEQIDYLLFCTQSPDYSLPTSACILQSRLGLPTSCGAMDFNLGCSGYVYGLSVAKGLIETGQCRNVLLLTGETYSKHMSPSDFSVRSLFGDAGTATWIGHDNSLDTGNVPIGPFVFGTDGSGCDRLILRKGSLRENEVGNNSDDGRLYMNGPDVYAFTLKTVPAAVATLLNKANKNIDEIDFFVFHQANKYMLENLRVKANIPEHKFIYALRDFGNTVSCTIPIALKTAAQEVSGFGGSVMLVGFGVGYSWAATILNLCGQEF